jgi:signal transduction histidine kinase
MALPREPAKSGTRSAQARTRRPKRAAATRVESAASGDSAKGLGEWLHESLPRASALILCVGADGHNATVLAAVRLPSTLVGQHFRSSTRLTRPAPASRKIRRTNGAARSALSGIELPRRLDKLNQWWLPVFLPAGSINAIVVFTPGDRGKQRSDERLLKTSLRLLQATALAHLRQQWPEVHPAISAKQQWEATVDMLPEIICLLDQDRHVLRVNRGIEHWGLGSVRESRGLELHALLHSRCHHSSCMLLTAIDDAWVRASRNGSSEARFDDPVLSKTLAITIRYLASKPSSGEFQSGRHAVCLIEDVTALTAAQQQLRHLNARLEARVRARTDELLQANVELKQEIARREVAERALLESRNELSLLSVELMHAQEIERKHISQELHDSVGQALSAVKYTLERSIQLLEHPQLGNLAEALDLAISHVHRTINDVRAISSSLRPPLLDDLGPASAVREFCREWNTVYPHVELHADIRVEDGAIPEFLGVSVFRTVQEALNNIAKHACAKKASVVVYIHEQRLYVEVTDDGVGFSAGAASKLMKRGNGWRGMRERAEHDGGHFKVTSTPGRGTALSVDWSLQRVMLPRRSTLQAVKSAEA